MKLFSVLAIALSFAVAAAPVDSVQFKDIQTAFSQGRLAETEKKAEEFERAFTKSDFLAQVQNLNGLCKLQKRDWKGAISEFQKSVNLTPVTSPILPYLKYNLANAKFEAGEFEDAQQLLKTIDATQLDRDNQIKVYYLRARNDFSRKAYYDSARNCIQSAKLTHSTLAQEQKNALTALFDRSLSLLTQSASLQELAVLAEESSLADRILLRLGKSELSEGKKDLAKKHFQMILSQYPDSTVYAEARALLSDETTGTPAISPTPESVDTEVDSKKIGILLPLSGKFARFGSRALQGIELAFQIFEANAPKTYSLVVEDSGDDAESAATALSRLTHEHHVVGVIGPLLSKGIEKVTQKAQDLQIPLISLSRSTVTSGDYIFNAGISMKAQTREIAQYAVKKLGIRRFAILYPRDKAGEESMNRFWDSVDELGGEILGVESYVPGETDFRQSIDRLSGRFYSEAREREILALAKDRDLKKIKKKTRKNEQFFTLPPIVDYEAVFIPEDPRIAGQILPTFAYRDVDAVRFLGTSAWNSPELAERALNSAEHAYFVDLFLASSTQPSSKKYCEKFEASFQQEPSAIDALAFDAGKAMVRALAQVAENNPRRSLKEALQQTKDLPGATGKMTYLDGVLSRPLKILTIKSGQIVETAF